MARHRKCLSWTIACLNGGCWHPRSRNYWSCFASKGFRCRRRVSVSPRPPVSSWRALRPGLAVDVLKNLALGVYYPGDGFLHRLQARTKLLALFWFFLVLAIANHHEGRIAPHLAVTAVAVLAAYSSSVPVSHIWQRARFLAILLGSILIW